MLVLFSSPSRLLCTISESQMSSLSSTIRFDCPTFCDNIRRFMEWLAVFVELFRQRRMEPFEGSPKETNVVFDQTLTVFLSIFLQTLETHRRDPSHNFSELGKVVTIVFIANLDFFRELHEEFESVFEDSDLCKFFKEVICRELEANNISLYC